jgi:hypothetical protein
MWKLGRPSCLYGRFGKGTSRFLLLHSIAHTAAIEEGPEGLTPLPFLISAGKALNYNVNRWQLEYRPPVET